MTPEEFWNNFDKTTRCWNWKLGTDDNGYGRVRVDGVLDRVHRHSFRLKRGPIPNGKCVLHKCDNPLCGRPGHLYAGTKKSNAEDRERRGRSNHAIGMRHGRHTHPGQTRGEKNGRSKLTKVKVKEFRRRLGEGEKKAALAREFLISKTTAGRIADGRLWPEV